MYELKRWLLNVKDKLPYFLDSMKTDIPGKFRFAYKGNYDYGPGNWGLANSVYAAKLYYMLNDKNLIESNRSDLSKFITKFFKKNGDICDEYVEKQSLFYRIITALKTQDLNNINNKQTRRAESRQAYSALLSLDSFPKFPYTQVKLDSSSIKKYMEELNWRLPYGAGSHFSHLAFFLYIQNKFFDMDDKSYEFSKRTLLSCLNKLRRSDGFWYSGRDPGSSQRINGCMKILTGLKIIDEISSLESKELILDGCLSWSYSKGACDNFDIVYPLYYCSLGNNYRKDEIKKLAIRQAYIFKQHYHERYGGFSFFKGKSNTRIYGMKVSKGLNVPDIHGTVLYFWGVVLISKILEMEIGIRDQIT